MIITPNWTLRRVVGQICGICLAGLLTVAPATACLDDALAGQMARNMLDNVAIKTPAVTSMDDGYCTQAKIVERMSVDLGGVAGYKAGLTARPAQERFGVSEPISGVLLHDMLLRDGASVPADFAARPLVEADLIVTVGDASINQAETIEEVLATLRDVRPFIELPDLVVANPDEITGPVIAAINVGAKLGVMGAPVAVEQSSAFLAALADMTVSMSNSEGEILLSVPGAAVLGHPLNAVLFLLKRGIKFQAGDVISLGAFGPFQQAVAGQSVTVSYSGLPGDPSVTVSFR